MQGSSKGGIIVIPDAMRSRSASDNPSQQLFRDGKYFGEIKVEVKRS